jgi:N-acetylglucosaminyl-diphospho-decaprenol L-rhamnosyltransferase
LVTHPGSHDPRVTVVVLSRDRREAVLAGVGRHLALPGRPPVIVVDNASGDGTPSALAAAHPDVELIRLERNLGGAGRNVGARAARTPYVAFTDDDAWWDADALRRATELLDAHPRLAVVQPHVLVGADERDDPVCAEMAASPLPLADRQPGHAILSFVACAVVVRRDAFLSIGGFPERLQVGGEEEIVGWDLAGAGWLMSYVDDVVAHHDPPHTPGGRPERREIGIRNMLWTTWLRRPLGAAAVRTVRTIARLPPDRVTARGISRALAGMPAVLRGRRVSPPHVERMRRLLDGQQLSSMARRDVD